MSGLPDLGGVINGDNVNDLQDALKHAQQYFDAGARIGDAADAAYAAAQAHLASLRERERKATASKGALGNAAGSRLQRRNSRNDRPAMGEWECVERADRGFRALLLPTV